MICPKCGAQLADDSKFCPNCGAAVEAPPVVNAYAPQNNTYTYTEPTPVYTAPVQNAPAAGNDNSTSVLVFGILGLSFACSFYLSLLGIIFSAVAKKKAKAYEAAYGDTSGKVRVGKRLAKAGTIIGIILLVFFVIYLIVMVAAGVMQGLNGYYNY